MSATSDRVGLALKIALGAIIFLSFCGVLATAYLENWGRRQEKAECKALGGKVLTLRGDFICEYDLRAPSAD